MLEDQIEQLRRDARNSRAEVERLKQDNYRIHKHREELEAEVFDARTQLEHIEKAVPETFYAGTDVEFRVTQLVRIWSNAVKANAELEAEVERLRGRILDMNCYCIDDSAPCERCAALRGEGVK